MYVLWHISCPPRHLISPPSSTLYICTVLKELKSSCSLQSNNQNQLFDRELCSKGPKRNFVVVDLGVESKAKMFLMELKFFLVEQKMLLMHGKTNFLDIHEKICYKANKKCYKRNTNVRSLMKVVFKVTSSSSSHFTSMCGLFAN